MFWKNKKLEILPEDEVHFQPILGIRPEVYLAWLYGAAIAIVLFFILFYPGISKPGTVLLAESNPEGAAVFVDGVYQSATPARIFIPKGEHVVKISLPGFSPREQTIDVKGRLFGSLFFPQKQSISETLVSAEPEKAFAVGAADFAAWSFIGEPTSAYQMPQPLSEVAYRVGAADAGALNNILTAAARFASNRASLRDLIRAKYLVDNAGNAASPLSLLASTQNFLAYLNKNPAVVSVLSGLAPISELHEIEDSVWVKNNKEIPADEKTTPSEKRTGNVIAGLSFTEIVDENDSFFLSETIPLQTWERFLNTSPEWTNSTDFIEGVSWFAAKAFCNWIAEQIEKESPHLEVVRLPFNAELEAAERAGFAFDWQKYEWCEDFFAPFDFLSADAESISAVGSPERTVFNHNGEKVSLPPALYSPFVSFRVVVKW